MANGNQTPPTGVPVLQVVACSTACHPVRDKFDAAAALTREMVGGAHEHTRKAVDTLRDEHHAKIAAANAKILELSSTIAAHTMTISVQGTELTDLKNDKAERQRETRAFAAKIVIGQLTAGGIAAALAKFVL